MKLSITIPAYNEEKRIGSTLNSYSECFENLRNKGILDYEILVVINNTKDNTENIVKSFQKKNKRIKYLNFKQGGKGFAIKEGFKNALLRENDLIGFTDADMSISAKEYARIALKIGSYDGIIASRYVPGAIVRPKQTIQRIIASRVFNFLTRTLFLFNYRDTQCGAKIFKKDSIKKILPHIGMTQWGIDIDILHKAKIFGLKIKEIPIFWQDKEASKLKLKKTSIQMFFAIMQLRITNSPFRKLLRPLKPLIGIVWRALK